VNWNIVVPGVLLLGIVIFVHELGHFLAAKWRGVTVLKFSLGMGPEMFGFTHGGTRYCVSWIPLGGFVQMAGDHLEDDGSLPEGGREQFLTHPWFGRLIIAVAGPAANLVGAYLVIVLTFAVGFQIRDYPNVIGPLPDTTAAYAEGVREGDRIVRVDGHEFRSWFADLNEALRGLASRDTSSLELRRGEAPVLVALPADRMRTVLNSLDPLPDSAIVGGVSIGMPAYRAGIKEGDRILSVDGEPVQLFMDLSRTIGDKGDRRIVLRIERDGREFTLPIVPMHLEPGDDAKIGIEPRKGMEFMVQKPPTEALVLAFPATGQMVRDVYRSMWLTLTRPMYYKDSLGGPILIAQMASEAARKGFDRFLQLLAVIHVAVMAFNLLPVPLLDGGHITLAVLEGVRRRRVSGRTYMNFQKVGLVLVGTLFVFIISKDILRPIQRLRAVDQAPRESTTVEPSHR